MMRNNLLKSEIFYDSKGDMFASVEMKDAKGNVLTKTLSIDNYINYLAGTRKVKVEGEVSTGLLPVGTLAVSNSIDGTKSMYYFKKPGMFCLDYKEELYRVPHPGIIFRFSSNNHTEVYSVKEEKLEDLNANTKLYLWAYGHGYGNGSICTGSVQLHLENFHMAEELADKFLNAANSHANSSVDIKETLDYFKNHNTKKYPKKFLKELNVSKTLGDILV